MLEPTRREQTEFPSRTMWLRSAIKNTTKSVLQTRGSCRKGTYQRRLLVSVLLLVLFPLQSSGQTMIDSCSMHQPGVSSLMQMAPAGALEVALDGRPLKNTTISQFPTGTPLTMEISSHLHIKELLVRWSRLDGSDATGDVSGKPLAPFCYAPATGLLLVATVPSVSIQVDVPTTTEAIISVTAVLKDGTLAFDVFLVDMVSASSFNSTTAAASLKFLLLTTAPTVAPATADGPSTTPVAQTVQFGPLRSPTPSESTQFIPLERIGDEPTTGPGTTTVPLGASTTGPSTLASPLVTSPPTNSATLLMAPTKHPSSTLSLVPSDVPSLSSDSSVSPTDAVSGFPTGTTTTPSSLLRTIPPSVTIPSRLDSTTPSMQPDVETSSRLGGLSPTRGPAGFTPSASPTFMISSSLPSQSPIVLLSFYPSSSPTRMPSSPSPSQNPVKSPSSFPSSFPTQNPSQRPVESPSSFPSSFPTHNPSQRPVESPSSSPSSFPTYNPSSLPTSFPTIFIAPPTMGPILAATVSPTTISLRTSNSATPSPTSKEQPSSTDGPTAPSEEGRVPPDDSVEYSPAPPPPGSVMLSTRLLRILAFAAGFVITAAVALAVFILYRISPEYEERHRLERARGHSVMEIGSSYGSAEDE